MGLKLFLKRDTLLWFFEEAHLVGEKIHFFFYRVREERGSFAPHLFHLSLLTMQKSAIREYLEGCFALCFYFLLTYFTSRGEKCDM